MGDLEDVIEALNERGDDDLAEKLGKYTGTSLRQRAQKTGELEREIEELTKRLGKVESVPKREAAFKAAGVDFDQLRPAELRAIRELDHEGDEPSEEEVSKVIEELGLPMAEGSDETDEEPPEAAKIAGQARTATERKLGGSTSITPEDTERWSTEEIMGFRKKHPEEFEALKRGETVTGVTAGP